MAHLRLLNIPATQASPLINITGNRNWRGYGPLRIFGTTCKTCPELETTTSTSLASFLSIGSKLKRNSKFTSTYTHVVYVATCQCVAPVVRHDIWHPD